MGAEMRESRAVSYSIWNTSSKPHSAITSACMRACSPRLTEKPSVIPWYLSGCLSKCCAWTHQILGYMDWNPPWTDSCFAGSPVGSPHNIYLGKAGPCLSTVLYSAAEYS